MRKPPNRETTFIIYKLINLNKITEYVGLTIRPAKRFSQHTKWGKFKGRTDLRIEIIKFCYDYKVARVEEDKFRCLYGFKKEGYKTDEHKKKIGLSQRGLKRHLINTYKNKKSNATT